MKLALIFLGTFALLVVLQMAQAEAPTAQPPTHAQPDNLFPAETPVINWPRAGAEPWNDIILESILEDLAPIKPFDFTRFRLDNGKYRMHCVQLFNWIHSVASSPELLAYYNNTVTNVIAFQPRSIERKPDVVCYFVRENDFRQSECLRRLVQKYGWFPLTEQVARSCNGACPPASASHLSRVALMPYGSYCAALSIAEFEYAGIVFAVLLVVCLIGLGALWIYKRFRNLGEMNLAQEEKKSEYWANADAPSPDQSSAEPVTDVEAQSSSTTPL